MSDVEYPYLPEGRQFKFVGEDNDFMKEARVARETLAGDPSYPVGIVMVKDGQIVARAGNGYNQGRQTHVCPRLVLECPSGTGYDLCDLHVSAGHSEPMVVKEAQKAGIDTKGADVYMYGHWWCCEPCWKSMLDAGVRDVYLLENAHQEFARDKVYGAFLEPSVKSVYISGALTNLHGQEFEDKKTFYENLGGVCESMDSEVCIPHVENGNGKEKTPEEIFIWAKNRLLEHDVIVAEVGDPSLGVGGELVWAHQNDRPIVLMSKKGSIVSDFVRGNPAVVYHIEYEDTEQACRYLKNVLKQI